jgi:ribosome biogenesis GTPase
VTLKEPVTNTTFIDRFLATAEAYNVPVVIVINKIDLLVDEDEVEYLEAVKNLYEVIGYKVITMNALVGKGLNELKETLQGQGV